MIHRIKSNWDEMDSFTRIAAVVGIIVFFPVVLICAIVIAMFELFLD